MVRTAHGNDLWLESAVRPPAAGSGAEDVFDQGGAHKDSEHAAERGDPRKYGHGPHVHVTPPTPVYVLASAALASAPHILVTSAWPDRG
ncbi:hypothetical protein [Streptomyces sp. NBC_00057]|uniref:hypothetical protein n=1 Tax=Streptomyces sp. NBC_00057 TaxID=2975634 RepID=UPI003247C96A